MFTMVANQSSPAEVLQSMKNAGWKCTRDCNCGGVRRQEYQNKGQYMGVELKFFFSGINAGKVIITKWSKTLFKVPFEELDNKLQSL